MFDLADGQRSDGEHYVVLRHQWNMEAAVNISERLVKSLLFPQNVKKGKAHRMNNDFISISFSEQCLVSFTLKQQHFTANIFKIVQKL